MSADSRLGHPQVFSDPSELQYGGTEVALGFTGNKPSISPSPRPYASPRHAHLTSSSPTTYNLVPPHPYSGSPFSPHVVASYDMVSQQQGVNPQGPPLDSVSLGSPVPSPSTQSPCPEDPAMMTPSSFQMMSPQAPFQNTAPYMRNVFVPNFRPPLTGMSPSPKEAGPPALNQGDTAGSNDKQNDPPRRRGRPRGSRNKRIYLPTSIMPRADHISEEPQGLSSRMSSSHMMKHVELKKKRYSLDSFITDLCGPQFHPNQVNAAQSNRQVPFTKREGTMSLDARSQLYPPPPYTYSSLPYLEMAGRERGSEPGNQPLHYSPVQTAMRDERVFYSDSFEPGNQQTPRLVPVHMASPTKVAIPQNRSSDTSTAENAFKQTGPETYPGDPWISNPSIFVQEPQPEFSCMHMNSVSTLPINHCMICGRTGFTTANSVSCSRRYCQRLFCTNCILASSMTPGASVFNLHVKECIVCVYQSKKRQLTDGSQWHFEFRDETDAQFVRILRDMLPMGNGLFIEISKTRQPCWRRKLRNGARKHFSFRYYGGIFESRREALEIDASAPMHVNDIPPGSLQRSAEYSVPRSASSPPSPFGYPFMQMPQFPDSGQYLPSGTYQYSGAEGSPPLDMAYPRKSYKVLKSKSEDLSQGESSKGPIPSGQLETGSSSGHFVSGQYDLPETQEINVLEPARSLMGPGQEVRIFESRLAPEPEGYGNSGQNAQVGTERTPQTEAGPSPNFCTSYQHHDSSSNAPGNDSLEDPSQNDVEKFAPGPPLESLRCFEVAQRESFSSMMQLQVYQDYSLDQQLPKPNCMDSERKIDGPFMRNLDYVEFDALSL